MRNLILLIQKYRNLLFFLFLEFIAISFLFSWKTSSNYKKGIPDPNTLATNATTIPKKKRATVPKNSKNRLPDANLEPFFS